jgi:uncharacterized protein (TIGR03790 family)
MTNPFTWVGVIGSAHPGGLPLREGRIHCLSVGQGIVHKLASAFAVGLVLFCRLAAGSIGPTPESVVILANSDDPDSIPIAEHYAEVRGVPKANIIALKMPDEETITWREFIDQIWQPFQDELVKRKWIDAVAMNLTDEMGRRKYLISGHRIGAVVVCRGVPLRISHDPAFYKENKPYTANPQYQTNAGAVDSELSLLTLTGYPVTAFVGNPLYKNTHPSGFDRALVVMVSRLDGPTAKDALALVDNAVLAEKTGLIGRAYIDLGGPYPKGDEWLSVTADRINKLGFDLSIDRSPTTMPVTTRFDAPVLYFGWYAADITGPFMLPGFQFPPGAIALHIFSFSAHTLRSSTKGWCGPLVARGVTATVGNVYEPYLELLHRPDLLVEALSRGSTFVEAAYFALPALSWQSIAIGDPLYRPFGTTLAAQESRLGGLSEDQRDFVAIRRANLMTQSGNAAGALKLLESRLMVHQGIALGLTVSRLLQEGGDREAAGAALAFATKITSYAQGDVEVAHQVAQQLLQCGRSSDAVAVYMHVLSATGMERQVRLPILADARSAALVAHDDAASKILKVEIDRLVNQVLSE